jgi:Zn-dependent peptidase ImmA (M78 family)/DNA-binding XRE family transcriptional regulator
MNDNVAQNLIKLRVANKFTQEYVADKAGISLLAYRNIESTKSKPNISSLEKIANFYNIDTSELLKENKSQIKKVRFRALEKKNIRKREDIIYEVSAWLEKYNNIVGILNLTDEFKYQLSDLVNTTNDPIIMAKKVRERFGLSNGETVKDICNLIEFKAGIKILAKQFNSDSFFGLSAEDIFDGKIIVVNTWDRISVERRIFSIAHELGHILLHFNNIQEDLLSEDSTEEKEANTFASHFLMPQEDFISAWNKSTNCDFVDRVIRVKQIFRVSYQVVLYRLSEYIKANNVKDSKNIELFNVWKAFGISYRRKYGVKIDWKKEIKSELDENSKELRALSNQFYSSGRLAELVKKAVDDEKIDIETAANILNVSPNEITTFQKIWDKNPLYELK